jgi:mannitol/fructose-specific phosphotransferase system IIA component (Ntr-type)
MVSAFIQHLFKHPSRYIIRKLISAERNYTTSEKELTAIVHAMRTCYLGGIECVVITNHNPLTYLKSQQNLLKHQARWLK